jgi:hypothetical protein
MAWKLPPQPIRSDSVLDIEPINQNFLSVVSESAGYLNEHNFRNTPNLVVQRKSPSFEASALNTPAPKLPEDIGFRLFYSRKAGGSDPCSRSGTGWEPISANDFYATKAKTGFSLTATFRGGKVWICGSFNIHTHGKGRRIWVEGGVDDSGIFVDSDAASDKGFGFNCALEVDGAIVNESLVGSGDPTNENYLEGVPNKNTTPSPPQISFFKRGGGGINGANIPVVVDAVIDLTPGPHTIRIAIMDIRASNGDMTATKTYVSTSELFALEMVR